MFSNYKNSLQFLSDVKDIQRYEEDLKLAQKAFTDVVLDSTIAINLLKLKLNDSLSTTLKYKEKNSDHLEELINKFKSEFSDTDHKVNKLHEEFCAVMSKKSLSIKRSLMQLSNLLAQHELLNLPYYELSAYYKQIIDYRIQLDKAVLEKLSYSEALESLNEIFRDVQEVEDKTLKLIAPNSFMNCNVVAESSDLFLNEGCENLSLSSDITN